jgi:hypothetical protein
MKHEDGGVCECPGGQDTLYSTALAKLTRRVMVKYGLDINTVLCEVEFSIPQIQAIMVMSDCRILLDRLLQSSCATLGS